MINMPLAHVGPRHSWLKLTLKVFCQRFNRIADKFGPRFSAFFSGIIYQHSSHALTYAMRQRSSWGDFSVGYSALRKYAHPVRVGFSPLPTPCPFFVQILSAIPCVANSAKRSQTVFCGFVSHEKLDCRRFFFLALAAKLMTAGWCFVFISHRRSDGTANPTVWPKALVVLIEKLQCFWFNVFADVASLHADRQIRWLFLASAFFAFFSNACLVAMKKFSGRRKCRLASSAYFCFWRLSHEAIL